MKVRKAETADEAAIRKLDAKARPVAAIHPLMRVVELGVIAPLDTFFVAEHEGELIGMLSATPTKFGFWYAGHLYVEPEHRGRGIARSLFESAGEHWRDRGISTGIATEVDGSMAAPVLHAMGFRQAERLMTRDF